MRWSAVLSHVASRVWLFGASGAAHPLLQAVSEAVFSTGVIVGLVVLFRERFNRQGAAGRFLSEHAYAVYFIHPLVVVALGYAFSWLGAIAVVKFVIVGALAVPLCWVAAYAVRSLPSAKRVL